MNILERVCQAMSTCYGLRDEYHVQVSTPYKSVSTMNMVKKSEFVSQYEWHEWQAMDIIMVEYR